MELKVILVGLAGFGTVGFLSMILIVQLLHGNAGKRATAHKLIADTWPVERNFHWKHYMYQFLQRSYSGFLKTPFLRSFTLNVRSRLHYGINQDEYRVRLRSAGAVYCLFLLFVTGIAVLFLLNPDPLYLLTLLITAAVMNGLLLEAYANRLQRKMLQQTTDMFTGVRHAYHRHGIADEAILEASEEASSEVSAHGYRIYEALNSPDPQQSLEAYYETSPGRFLKTFGGISYLVTEYGDKKSGEGSLFLKALSELAKEIHLELLRLSKLDYLLKGLHVITLTPLFFTKPIEMWARSNFPLMDQFYAGKLGVFTKMAIYLIIFVCYVLLQKLKSEDEYTSTQISSDWEKLLYKHGFIRKLVKPLLPHPRSLSYIRCADLLKDTQMKMRIEWFYVRRIVFFVTSFIVVILVFLVIHANERNHILNNPAFSQMLFGTPGQEERDQLQAQAFSDQEIMKELGLRSNTAYEEIASRLSQSTDKPFSKAALNEGVMRIKGKLDRWNAEVLSLWEVAAALGAALCAYYAPLWLLLFQRSIRHMEMKHEIYQFYTLIFILKEMDRMSVEEILEWMNSFAVIFKTPIERGLLHYEHGQEEALEVMKHEVSFPDFQRLIDKLLLSVSKISVNRAFDDVDGEMGYYFEQRKLDYEKTLDIKANLGKMIGFAPLYALIFMYLVIPLIWMSFNQMSVYYEQIQKL